MTTSGPQLIEPIVMGLRERLEQGMPDEVNNTNVDYGDGYEIEPPAQVLDYVPPISTILEFPLIGLQHGRGTFEDDNAWSATGVYDIVVVCFVQDADQQALVRKLRRFTRAAFRVVARNRQFQTTWGIIVKSIDYGPALAEIPQDEQPPKTYYSWSAITLTCRQDEE